ncbi:hypothetical protein J6A31_05520 [bacterium]|nr:hypothetical protein [bacterium]
MRYIYTGYKFDPRRGTNAFETKSFATHKDAVHAALSDASKQLSNFKSKGVSYTYCDSKDKAVVRLKNGVEYNYVVESALRHHAMNISTLAVIVLGSLLCGFVSTMFWMDFMRMLGV